MVGTVLCTVGYASTEYRFESNANVVSPVNNWNKKGCSFTATRLGTRHHITANLVKERAPYRTP